MTDLLSYSALSVRRGDVLLLDGLAAVVRAGSLWHVRGANGSGKTSLLEVLAGLRRPEGGQLQRAAGLSVHWVGHRHGLHLELSPAENLRFWCALNRVDPKPVVAQALQALGLGAKSEQPCRTLSAGQLRRCALARLQLQPRPLWVLDEPLSVLDTAGAELLFAQIARQRSGGGAVVLSSHQALPDSLPAVDVVALS